MPDAIRALFVAPGRFYGEFMQALGDAHHVYEIIAVEDLATAEAVLARDPIRIAVVHVHNVQKESDLDPTLRFFRGHPELRGILALTYYESHFTGDLFQRWPSGMMYIGVFAYLWRPWLAESVQRILASAADALRQREKEVAHG